MVAALARGQHACAHASSRPDSGRQVTIVEACVVGSPKGARPKIMYRYHLDGNNYESSRIVVGGMWETSGNGPAQLVRQFPTGAVARAVVDPTDPSYSVLIPGIRVHQILATFFGVVIFAGTLVLLWLVLHLVPAA